MYTIAVKIAFINSPLNNGEKSRAGHMWYCTSDNKGETNSYGFGLQTPGTSYGPGVVTKTDNEHYSDPEYIKKHYLNVNLKKMRKYLEIIY